MLVYNCLKIGESGWFFFNVLSATRCSQSPGFVMKASWNRCTCVQSMKRRTPGCPLSLYVVWKMTRLLACQIRHEETASVAEQTTPKCVGMNVWRTRSRTDSGMAHRRAPEMHLWCINNKNAASDVPTTAKVVCCTSESCSTAEFFYYYYYLTVNLKRTWNKLQVSHMGLATKLVYKL